MAQKIKKGDQVIVLAGRDKGKKGEVIRVMPKDDRALVRGVLVGLVVPALFTSTDGRGIQDRVTATAVVRR